MPTFLEPLHHFFELIHTSEMINHCHNRSGPFWNDTKIGILFGHCASLAETENAHKKLHIFALDAGCLWGGSLTALRIEDREIFSIKSQEKSPCFYI